jgi:L-arabinose isomerase
MEKTWSYTHAKRTDSWIVANKAHHCNLRQESQSRLLATLCQLASTLIDKD